MIKSIRKFLIIYVTLTLFLIAFFSGFGDYYLSRDDVRAHMDALLEQMGLSFVAVVSTSLEYRDGLSMIDAEIASIEHESRYLSFLPSRTKAQSVFLAQTRYYFQLWNNKGKLLLSSTNPRDLNLAKVPEGFSDLYFPNGTRWRVFRIFDPDDKVNYIVGEQYTVRDELLHKIALNNVYIMLVCLPISMLLIWIIVGTGFKSLRRITDDIRDRVPSYLQPVDIQEIPIEIRPLIQELNNLFGRLQEAFEREKRFASDAAHELRTPLAAMKTQIQIALKSSMPLEREALLTDMIPIVDRITHIVQQLLVLSRLVPEAASVYDISDINLSKTVANVIAELVPLALTKNIDIGLEAPSSALIKGNLTSISMLIRNLVENAINYTPEKGKVHVEIIDDSQHIIFKITDTGQGIPKALRERVFERFYRIIGNDAPGSGLGLSIVRQIADIHHATVTLSAPKIGTGLIVEVVFNKK